MIVPIFPYAPSIRRPEVTPQALVLMVDGELTARVVVGVPLPSDEQRRGVGGGLG